ncbi:MAG TPA: hypothetical protein VI588_04455 [Candidatus Gracilibacteria bacterium]|nr:hypothetical protein [Candidatus Gracilibacteria bacterium]
MEALQNIAEVHEVLVHLVQFHAQRMEENNGFIGSFLVFNLLLLRCALELVACDCRGNSTGNILIGCPVRRIGKRIFCRPIKQGRWRGIGVFRGGSVFLLAGVEGEESHGAAEIFPVVLNIGSVDQIVIERCLYGHCNGVEIHADRAEGCSHSLLAFSRFAEIAGCLGGYERMVDDILENVIHFFHMAGNAVVAVREGGRCRFFYEVNGEAENVFARLFLKPFIFSGSLNRRRFLFRSLREEIARGGERGSRFSRCILRRTGIGDCGITGESPESGTIFIVGIFLCFLFELGKGIAVCIILEAGVRVETFFPGLRAVSCLSPCSTGGFAGFTCLFIAGKWLRCLLRGKLGTVRSCCGVFRAAGLTCVCRAAGRRGIRSSDVDRTRLQEEQFFDDIQIVDKIKTGVAQISVRENFRRLNGGFYVCLELKNLLILLIFLLNLRNLELELFLAEPRFLVQKGRIIIMQDANQIGFRHAVFGSGLFEGLLLGTVLCFFVNNDVEVLRKVLFVVGSEALAPVGVRICSGRFNNFGKYSGGRKGNIFLFAGERFLSERHERLHHDGGEHQETKNVERFFHVHLVVVASMNFPGNSSIWGRISTSLSRYFTRLA